MAYYTAVLARSGGQWQLRPSDIDAPEDLAEVSDAVRTASRGRGGLAIVEREDEWFAIVRVDGEEDPRIFVSDLPAARQGPFAVLFEDVEEWERPGAVSGSGVAERTGDGGQDLVAAGTTRSRVAGDHAAGLGGGDAAGATGGERLLPDDEDDHDDDDESLSGEADQDADVLDGTDDLEALAGPDAADLDDQVGLDDVDDVADVDGLDAEPSGARGLEAVDIEDEDDEADDDLAAGAATALGRTGHDVTDFGPSTEGGGRRSGASGDRGVALAPAPLQEVVWAGDLGVLEDYGLAPLTLKLIVEDGDPSAALLAIGEQAGFADVIDEWH